VTSPAPPPLRGPDCRKKAAALPIINARESAAPQAAIDEIKKKPPTGSAPADCCRTSQRAFWRPQNWPAQIAAEADGRSSPQRASVAEVRASIASMSRPQQSSRKLLNGAAASPPIILRSGPTAVEKQPWSDRAHSDTNLFLPIPSSGSLLRRVVVFAGPLYWKPRAASSSARFDQRAPMRQPGRAF